MQPLTVNITASVSAELLDDIRSVLAPKERPSTFARAAFVTEITRRRLLGTPVAEDAPPDPPLTTTAAWWHACLDAGCIAPGWAWDQPIRKEVVEVAYLEWVRANGGDPERLGSFLKRTLGEGLSSQQQRVSTHARAQFWHFPPLAECKARTHTYVRTELAPAMVGTPVDPDLVGTPQPWVPGDTLT